MDEFLAQPGFLGTYGTIGADLSFLLATLFTAFFLIGWRAARKHHGNAHRFLVLSGMFVMLGYFPYYYSIRRLGVLAIEGREGFGGPDWFYSYLFSPILTIHILFVSTGLVIAVYMVLLGFRASRNAGGKRVLAGGELKVKKRSFYIALSATLTAGGLLALIRCETLRCATVYGVVLAIIAFVFFFERVLERLLPKGRDRHIFLGRFTMVIFIVVLLTAGMTYLSLYILYQPSLT